MESIKGALQHFRNELARSAEGAEPRLFIAYLWADAPNVPPWSDPPANERELKKCLVSVDGEVFCYDVNSMQDPTPTDVPLSLLEGQEKIQAWRAQVLWEIKLHRLQGKRMHLKLMPKKVLDTAPADVIE